MVADPGGQQVGQISIRVVPNTARFGQELRAQLQKLERTLQVELPVEVDTAGVTQKVKEVAHRASGEEVKLDTDLDTGGIVRAARRVKNLAQKATGAIKLTAELNTKQSLARIWGQMKIIQTAARAYSIRVPVEWAGLTKLLGVAGLASGAMLSLNNVITAVGGALKAVGGIALTLPAAFVAAGAGVATLVVGLRGFFDALKNSGDAAKFEESLQKLAPSARESARALAAFREPLKEIQQATQQSLFEGMAGSFSKLGVLLPPIRSGMVGVAAGIREMARSWLDMATSQQSVRDLDAIMRGTSDAFRNASPAAANFSQALRDIAAVGASFLPGMGQAVTNISEKFRDFIASARESGKLGEWIRSGIDSFKKFGQVLANVWGIFSNITRAMHGGQSLLDMLVKVTAKAKELSGSAQGQAAWASLAAVMREVLDAAQKVFVELFSQAADILKELTPFLVEFAKQLGGALVAALKIVGPMLQALARFLSENKAIMAPLLVVLTGVVTAFKVLSTVATGIQTLANAFTAMQAAANIAGTALTKVWQGLFTVGRAVVMTTVQVVTGAARMVASLVMMGIRAATTAAVWVAQMATMAASTVANFVRMAISATVNAGVVAATWLANAARITATWIAQTAVMAATAIANWVRMAISATVNAGVIAASWLANAARITATWVAQTAVMAAVAIGNWVRMAVQAAVQAGVIAATWIAQGVAMAASWIASMARIAAVTIANFVRMAAVALAQAARMAASWFIAMGPVGWVIGIVVALVALIIANWDKVKAATIAVWNAVSGFLVGVWNGIKNVAASVWNWITSTISGAVNGAKNAVVGGFNAVVGFFGSLPGRIVGALGDLGSLLWNAGKAIIQGLINGVKSAIGGAVNAVKSAVSTIRSFFPFSPAKRGPFSGKGYTLYSGRALMEDWAKGVEDKAPEAMRTVRGLMEGASTAASAEWHGTMSRDDFGIAGSVRDGVLAGFNGARLQVDGSGVAKLVNNVNQKNARR